MTYFETLLIKIKTAVFLNNREYINMDKSLCVIMSCNLEIVVERIAYNNMNL